MRHNLPTLLYKMQIAGYRNADYRVLLKKTTHGKVNWTARVRRLKFWTVLWCMLGLGLPCLCLPVTVAWANWCALPWEKMIQRFWIRRAKKILKRHPDIIRIGITGSYGKTSVKNILTAMLQTQFRVVQSPASFNTPLGFARTINENLQSDTQVLIMEMGARRPGEIREMCQLCQPQHGIITSIGPCHLSTFGSIESVAHTKAELLAFIPAEGWLVTDGDNPWCQKLQHPHLIAVQSNNSPTYTTSLSGAYQQKNVQMAAALAERLGIPAETIRTVVANLKPTPHRLEKIVASNGIIILDDSYNANPVSAQNALSALGEYPSFKVVQTPGFVEQGANSAAAHATLCDQIKTVADAVIVVGEVNRVALAQGLQGWSGQIFYAPTRESAKQFYPQLLKSGDVLLLLNDLPESY